MSARPRWESVTNPLDRLPHNLNLDSRDVGNQLPILLIDFTGADARIQMRWESVTNPLDRLPRYCNDGERALGISYQSS